MVPATARLLTRWPATTRYLATAYHDLGEVIAARTHALPALCRATATGLPTLADPGYDGASIEILIPVKPPPGGRELDLNTRTRSAIQRSLRVAPRRR